MTVARNNHSFFSSSKSITQSITNTLNWLYEHSPVNFSNLTGWHHPTMSRLMGDPFTGRLIAMGREEGVEKELNTLGELAIKDPKGRAYCSISQWPTVLLTDPSDIAQVFLFNDDHISREMTFRAFSAIMGEHNLISIPKNEEWDKKRKLLKSFIFTPGSLDEVVEPMQKIIDEFIDDIAKNQGRVPSLELFMVLLTMDVFTRSRLATSTMRANAKEISDAFFKALNEASEVKNNILLRIATIQEYLHIRAITPLAHERASLYELVKKRVLEPNQASLRHTKNILQNYFTQHPNDNQSAFEAAVEDTAFMLFTGHETTSRLLQFTFMVLARHPDILQKLRDEIEMKRPANGEWTREDLKDMHYLRKIIKESLRLYPPVPILSRTVNDPIVLGDLPRCQTAGEYKRAMAERDETRDVVLHPGTILFVSPWITHRLAKFYEDPLTFNPERFKSDEMNLNTANVKEAGDTCEWFPFGIGSRNCVGRLFAVQETEIALIKLVENYDFKLVNDQPEQPKLLNIYQNGTLKHRGEVEVEFIPRVNNLDSQTRLSP